ncbi:MAG: efflux RND transporter periplasmic adaptor subunit [Sphingomonadales bacterium]|nr:efflux RND transporter periplasmic adaptor subunit [Sphingomonadales bacterium]
MNYDARIEGSGRDDSPSASADSRFDHAQAVAALEADDDDDRARRRRNRLLGGLGAAALIGVWFAVHHGRNTDDDGKAINQAPSVTVITPGRGMVTGSINASGSLAARREIPVGSVGEGGQIASVLVDAGQWVKKGQVLAVIDRSVQVQQLANNQAQISSAEADARLAQANLDRALKLVDRGFISRADVDRLTATRDGANARVRIARAQLGETGARVRRLSIVAPEGGLLLERRVEPGQVVGSGSGVLFRIALGGEIEMKAQLGEVELAQIHPGVDADVTPVGSQQHFTGKVWQVSPFIDPQSRQGMVRIALTYSPELRPGGFASAVIHSGSVQAPMLPDSAILNDGQQSYVFIVGKANKAERRNITLGMVTDHGIAIAGGLSGNERVVLRAGSFLSPGESMNPVPAGR